VCQGHTFCHATKVLSIGCYDMILGAGWLEQQGSMWVDWKHKSMKFAYMGKVITLQEVVDDLSACPHISGRGLCGLLKRNVVSHMLELNLNMLQD
jgi:hypothetical protein